MNTTPIHKRNLLVTIFILAIAAIRVGITGSGQLHALTSFSPIGAMALFGGACFSRRGLAFAVPLATLLVSDALLAVTIYSKYSNGILYSGWYWVYGAFALMVLVGRWQLQQVTAKNILIAAIGITCIHWLVTDLGVWLGSSMYPQTPAGFWLCLEAAIPFEKNFLLGTLFYSAVLFGGFEWVKRRQPVQEYSR